MGLSQRSIKLLWPEVVHRDLAEIVGLIMRQQRKDEKHSISILQVFGTVKSRAVACRRRAPRHVRVLKKDLE